MARFVAIAGLSTVLLSASPSAQSSAPGTFDTLRLRTAQVNAMRGVIELRAPLPPVDVVSTPQSAVRSLRVTSQRARPGSLRRERRPELSADRLVVVVIDHQGAELDWRLVADPRVVRVETADADGRLSGVTRTRPDAEFVFQIPDLPGAAAVRIYQAEPREHAASGTGRAQWALTLLGALTLQ